MTRSMLLVAVAAIALGLSANHAIAHSSAGNGKKLVAHGETHSAANDRSRKVHRLAMAHRSSRRAAAFGAPASYAAPPGIPAYRWPGYTYVPRKGIVDEACNLPTSACPNEMRDIR